MPPLVSILIPAYNGEWWIADTIKSALNQIWPSKEIITVDDGSRDHTLSIARQFASRNFCVVTQENQSASRARNKALELCHGDYIQWLDADDLLSPDKVARQMAAAEECQDRRRRLSSACGYFMFSAEWAECRGHADSLFPMNVKNPHTIRSRVEVSNGLMAESSLEVKK
jgi:glycosyltransferase involved in cell wall biosynthesis